MQAARAEEAAALFDLAGVRTSIAGEVATNYVDARLAQARLVIARSTLSTQDDNLQIARYLISGALDTSFGAGAGRISPWSGSSFNDRVALDSQGRILVLEQTSLSRFK